MFFDRAMWDHAPYLILSISLNSPESWHVDYLQVSNGKRMNYLLVIIRFPTPPRPPLIYVSDPISLRSNSYNWPPKNRAIFRASPKTQRHRRVHCRHSSHTVQMASGRFPGRIVWYICVIRRLFRYNSRVCGKHTGCRTIYCAGSGEDQRWEEECWTACLNYRANHL